jgi:hypothetical protein
VTEYTYVAAAAYHGSAPDLESDEIRLHTRDALRQGVPGTVAVFESTDYRFATDHWPTGQYPHQSNIVYSPQDAENRISIGTNSTNKRLAAVPTTSAATIASAAACANPIRLA